MNREPAIISGMGTISAAGCGVDDSLNSMGIGARNHSPMATIFETSLNYPVFEACGLKKKYFLEGQRTISLALCAVDEALESAGLQGGLAGIRVGVCMGTTVSSQLNDKDFYFTFRKTGSAPLKAVDRYIKKEISDYILRKTGGSGLSLTVVNACSSGTDAMGVALSWLREGVCDIAIAGGSDELNHIPLCGFGSLGIVSNAPCMPFDKNRNGLNLGEGAGVFILETGDSARKRGIKPLLRLSGYGSSADAYHLTAPRPDGYGLKKAIGRALEEAGIKPEEIGFINAHGTATPDNDKVEGKVFKEIFGGEVKMLSTKGYTGHTLGGAGGIEAVFTASGLREGWIPASAGFETYDETVGLSPVTKRSIVKAKYALSTSLAFGGNNAALVVGIE